MKPMGSRLTCMLVAIAVSLSLAGCASFSPDGGMASIQATAKADLGAEIVKIGDDVLAANAEARARALLKKGLTADRAVPRIQLKEPVHEKHHIRILGPRPCGEPDGGFRPGWPADGRGHRHQN